MPARDETRTSQPYTLAELLRDRANHVLLLTATPHRGMRSVTCTDRTSDKT